MDYTEENWIEFEFNNFSVLKNQDTSEWLLRYYDEDLGECELELDDSTFEDEKDVLDSLHFNVEDFERLKLFK